MTTSIATDFAAIAARIKSVSLPDSDDAELIQRYRRYTALHEALEKLSDDEHLRQVLVSRYGESWPNHVQRDADPEYRELMRRAEEANRLCEEYYEVSCQIMAMRANSREGVLAKLRIALNEWPARRLEEDDVECHEEYARAAILDAVRVLEAEEKT